MCVFRHHALPSVYNREENIKMRYGFKRLMGEPEILDFYL